MKGMRGASQPAVKTPRARNALVDRRNPAGVTKQEFTPLLKSAQRKQMLRRSMLDESEKENMDAIGTPAGFRSSYAEQATQLPINSSMLDPDNTQTSSADGKGESTPVAPIASSSMLDSTPIPHLPQRGAEAVLNAGNGLTLRDQEAKLDQIQKDNFGLKLKIHYLEQALQRTGTAFQQQTLKENVELKTTQQTQRQEIVTQKKRLADAAHELE
ncbi:hypothetical protein LTR53_018574, partial [Teratosphaeriaceae sp. CCFEE 6253]